MQPNQVIKPSPKDAPDPSQFDFITKSGRSPKSGLSFGSPIKLAAIAGVILIVALVAVFLFARGGSGPKQQVTELLAKATEIDRVTTLEERQLKNESTLNFASTTSINMQSQISDYTAYLKKSKTKVTVKQLALLGTNKQTDLQLQTAQLNNNLDAAYLSYLKSSLADYQSSIKNLYTISKSKSLKESLSAASDSVAVLLNSPQLKNA